MVVRLAPAGHTGYIFGLAVNGPGGDVVLSCSDDAKAILWDGHTGSKMHVLNGHVGAVMDVTFMPQKVTEGATSHGPQHNVITIAC